MPTSQELSEVMSIYPKLKYFEELSCGLTDSLQNSLFADVQIEVEGETFSCHRIILASMSHYFKTMFTSKFKESGLPKVHLKDLNKDIFRAALEYIYTGQSSVKNSNVYHLLSCSSMLQIKGLQSICSEFLQKSLCHNNCIGIWKMATGHGLPELQKKSWETIQQNFPEVSKCDEFLHLSQDELIQIIDCKDLFTVKEEDVCDAVLRWIKGDTSRKKGLVAVFKVLRLTQMSLDYLCNVREGEEIEECSGCRTLVLEAIDKINSALPNEFSCPESEYRQEEVVCMVGTRSREPNPQKIEVLCYSFRHDNKFKFSTLPVEPGPCFAVCILNRDIYISGGYNQQNLMLHFNTEHNTWTECKQMKIERWSHSMVAVGKNLYLLGGTSKTNVTLSSIEKFDPESGTYEEVGHLEEPVSSMTAAVFGTKIITFGGKLRDRNSASVIQFFDVSNKTKGVLGNLPECCAGSMGRAVYFEDRLIIVFREGQVVEYSEDTGPSIVCMIDKFDHFGAVNYNGEILVLGNRSGSFYAVLFNPYSGKSKHIPAPFKAPMCNFYCLKTICQMHSELYEVTATVTLGVLVLSCSLFMYWSRDFKENPDTRKQCPSDTTRIVQEENDERWRLQPTPFPSSDDQLSRRKRRFKRRRKRKQNLNASVAVECNVPVTPHDFQPVARDDNQFFTNRNGSYCCQELDLESQKGQPYTQAILQNNEHDWKTIAAALAYLHKHNALERVAKTVLKAIQHMQDLVKVPVRGYTEYMGYKIPNDYSQTELWDIVLVQYGDMKRVEFEWVHREFVQSHGYPPTPYEFSKLYEKCIETEKLRKHVDKLRKKKDETERRLENERQISKEVRKENNILKSRVVHLEGLVSRALCKICLVNEVSVMYQPCEHALVCRSCHEQSMVGKSKRARTCSICNCHIKTSKNLILA